MSLLKLSFQTTRATRHIPKTSAINSEIPASLEVKDTIQLQKMPTLPSEDLEPLKEVPAGTTGWKCCQVGVIITLFLKV